MTDPHAFAARTRPRRRGFNLVELLVVIAIIAILSVLLLPAVNAAREAARMAQCKNNIRQLAIALNLHHGAQGRFPPGWVSRDPAEPDGEPGWGWGVELLPFLEEKELYKTRLRRSKPIDDPDNELARQSIVAAFLCPSDPSPLLVPLPQGDGDDHDHQHAGEEEGAEPDAPILFEVARSNYAGVFGSKEIHDEPAAGDGIFYLNSRTRIGDLADGVSKTIIVGERSSKLGGSVWIGVVHGAQANMERVVGTTDHPPNSPQHHFDDFSSHHASGAHFAMADGSALLLSDEVDPQVYRALSTRAGGEPIPAGFGDR